MDIAVSHQSGSPLRDRGFVALLIASTGVFFGFSLLVSVVPLWVVTHGAGEFAAGAVTGVFMAATVVVQFLMPRLVHRFGYRAMAIAGAILLGAPAPLLLLATAWQPVLAISLVRGAGFGIVTVCGSALIAELLRPDAHGRGSGLYGLAVGVPLLVGLPTSTWVAQHVGFAAVFAAGAFLPLLAVWPLLTLPAVGRGATTEDSPVRSAASAVLRPWLPMLSGSIAFGALTTFLPLLFAESPAAASVGLLLMSGTALVARWMTGVVGDRSATRGTWLLGGLALTSVGLAGIALGAALAGGAAVTVGLVCVAIYGTGFGAVQNEALVVMFRRVSAARASVAWNVAFDAGQGLGAVAVGAIAATTNYAVAFGCLGLLSLLLLPATFGARATQ